MEPRGGLTFDGVRDSAGACFLNKINTMQHSRRPSTLVPRGFVVDDASSDSAATLITAFCRRRSAARRARSRCSRARRLDAGSLRRRGPDPRHAANGPGPPWQLVQLPSKMRWPTGLSIPARCDVAGARPAGTGRSPCTAGTLLRQVTMAPISASVSRQVEAASVRQLYRVRLGLGGTNDVIRKPRLLASASGGIW